MVVIIFFIYNLPYNVAILFMARPQKSLGRFLKTLYSEITTPDAINSFLAQFSKEKKSVTKENAQKVSQVKNIDFILDLAYSYCTSGVFCVILNIYATVKVDDF